MVKCVILSRFFSLLQPNNILDSSQAAIQASRDGYKFVLMKHFEWAKVALLFINPFDLLNRTSGSNNNGSRAPKYLH